MALVVAAPCDAAGLPLGIALGALTHYPYTPWPFCAPFSAAVCGLAGLAWWPPKGRRTCAAAVLGSLALHSRGNVVYFLPLFWLTPTGIVGWSHLEHPVAGVVPRASDPSMLASSARETSSHGV